MECEQRYSDTEYSQTDKDRKCAGLMSATPCYATYLHLALGLPADYVAAGKYRVFVAVQSLLREIHAIWIVVVSMNSAAFFICRHHTRQTVAEAIASNAGSGIVATTAQATTKANAAVTPKMRTFAASSAAFSASTATTDRHRISRKPEGGQQERERKSVK